FGQFGHAFFTFGIKEIGGDEITRFGAVRIAILGCDFLKLFDGTLGPFPFVGKPGGAGIERWSNRRRKWGGGDGNGPSKGPSGLISFAVTPVDINTNQYRAQDDPNKSIENGFSLAFEFVSQAVKHG